MTEELSCLCENLRAIVETDLAFGSGGAILRKLTCAPTPSDGHFHFWAAPSEPGRHESVNTGLIKKFRASALCDRHIFDAPGFGIDVANEYT